MRIIICILLTLTATYTKAQYYNIFFDNAKAVPEFITEGTVIIGNTNADGIQKPISKSCIIRVAKGEMNGRYLRLDRKAIQENKGKQKFFITCNGQTDTIISKFSYLKNIQFNLYTDSIKPIMNYYVNIEGEFSTGRILPLNNDFVEITASKGKMSGMEWVAPDNIDFDYVEFTAICPFDPSLAVSTKVYIQQVNKDE